MTAAGFADALRSGTAGPLDMLPYGRLLALSFARDAGGVHLLMPYADALIGSPGRLHGGSIAGLMELAGMACVITAQPAGEPLPRIRPITITVDFMREGAARDTYAAGTVSKLGRRVVNVRTTAWQADRAKPIAAANINFLIDWP
ncbi:PaaI family thioesterase [Sandarakinorhabdus sp.]|uniref:PaaI family thioesterase n=1 Tax=Sandarakinorhabdus sp. TaxID=1916663 RepID=UPI00286DB854|nr:PaaI family thioesterase [Sandarakinorhabdus sp.]